MTSLVEVRLLDGPNLYFPRAAVKLTLDAAELIGAPASRARAAGTPLGVPGTQPGEAGSEQRQQFAMRVVRQLVRRLAMASGVTRLAVRARTGADVHHVVLAYPWRHAGRAEALGHAVAAVLDALLDRDDGDDTAAVLESAASTVRSAELGRTPSALRPRVPVVSVTGTNGKTTTTRLLAHLAMTAGLRTGWSSTDGVVVQGEMIEPGDYSGPAGARRVLEASGVQVGVLETARGGLLLRGMGVVANDVSVVTNVSADHLGLQGIDTLDQLAEVKSVITRVTKRSGWTVLNGDDPRVLAMRALSPGQPFVFSLDPGSPALRESLNAGGRGITVLDGDVAVLSSGADPDRLVHVVDVPVTLSGLSEHNVANALAATAAALGLGLPRDAVVDGLRSFRPDPSLNPGRMNLYTVAVPGGSVTVVVDLAHNEAGLEALLHVCRGVCEPGSRVLLGLGTAGDRTDVILMSMGAIAAMAADRVAVVHKERYLRGRSAEDLESWLRRGAASVGVLDLPSFGSELEGLQHLLADAGPGDVVAVMAHADRDDVQAWLASVGGTPDEPDTVRAKVVAARGQHPEEDAIVAARDLTGDARLAAIGSLVAGSRGDARLLYERASALDAEGRGAESVTDYRKALANGLREPHRTAARVQLASSLRGAGELDLALAELDALLVDRPDSATAAAFRALVLHDLGRSTEAVAQAVSELARHLAGGDAEAFAATLQADAERLTP